MAKKLRFWIEDEFIDTYAKTLSIKAQAVFMCYKRHCNGNGETTIGIRKIAELLGVNKETVSRAVKELELSGFVGQRKNKLSGFSPRAVRQFQTELSDKSVHKELGIKERNRNLKLDSESGAESLKEKEALRLKMIEDREEQK